MTLIILGLIGGLFHLGRFEVRAFEHSAAADIRSKLSGDQREVSVKADVGIEGIWGDVHAVAIHASRFQTEGLPLYTEPKRSHRGVVRDLTIRLSDFSLSGMHIESLDAEIPDCRFDLPLAMRHREIRLSRSGLGLGRVVVNEKDLENFILLKFHEIKQVSVKIDKDKIFVDGSGEFLFLKTTFSVIAKLDSPDGNQLFLTYARIFLDGHPADNAQKKVLLDTLNPVLDLDSDLKLNGAIRVESIELRNGLLSASGPTKIPDVPLNRSSGS